MDRMGGYEIRESLSQDSYFHLWRGWDEQKGQSVLLKGTQASHPDLKEITQL